MPPPFTSYTPAAGWEKAADHPISYLSILWSRLKNPTFIRGLLALKTQNFGPDPRPGNKLIFLSLPIKRGVTE